MNDFSYTVLIIDDSISNRAFLADILEEDGYRILLASNGEDGLKICRAEQPVLVLLDVVMPEMDGFETLQRMKDDPLLRRISVIMLTSLGAEESKLEAFDKGAVDYIVKSANVAEVRARVRVHVRLAAANDELFRARFESIQKISQAQKAFLVKPEELPEAKFSVYYRALNEAGGDFYDVVKVADDVYFYLIADVAGHDIGTSYVTPAVKVLLRQCATPAYQVEESISFMHRVLTKTFLEDNYLTAFALRINRRAGKAVFLSAGHPPAVFIPKDGNLVFAECENPFIGMIEENSFSAKTIDVKPGDRFVLYTDGLVEEGDTNWSQNPQRLINVLEKLRNEDLPSLANKIVMEMIKNKPEDDLSIMVVEV